MRKTIIFLQMIFIVNLLFMYSPAEVRAETAFAPRVDLPTTNPFFIAAGDLNNDANSDLVVANWSANTITVFLGSGDGTFTAQSPLAVGVHPNSIATGFMNDDAYLDLAVASGGGIRDVTLLLGDGSGGFSSIVSIDVTNDSGYLNGDADINYLISGDFDGDGEVDLALAKNSGYPEVNDHIKLMKGDGAGGFTPLSATDVGNSASGPFGLAAGNFDGDGYPDLAVTMYDSGTVKIYLNDGAGAFTEAGGSPVTVGAGPLRVVTADLNNDGAADLVVSNYDGNSISVLLGNGDGTFSAAPGSSQALGTNPLGLTGADINGDGNPDVVVTNRGASTFSLYTGNGDGTFQPGQDYGTGAGPISLVSGDFDGDGKTDAVVANSAGNTVSVFLQTECAPPPSGMLSWWAGDGNAADLIGNNDGTLVNGAGYTAGMVGQAFSFDGADDYVDLPAAATSALTNEAGSITAWVRPSAIGDNDMIAVFGSGADGEGVGLGILNNVRIYHHTAGYDWQTDTPVGAGEWTHLAYTWDDTTEQLYKNGVFSESRPRNFSYVPGHGRIGDGFWNDSANPFPGLIDEVQTYSHTLTPEEVRAIYTAGSSGVCRSCAARPDDMISWWRGEGDATDFMGSLDGTFAAATYASGMVGQSFSLDGGDDVVDIPHSIPAALLGSAPKTVTAWVNPSSYPAEIFMMGNINDAGGSFRLVTDASGQLGFDVSVTVAYSSQVVPLNQWSLVAGTWDGTNYQACLNGTCEVVPGLPAQNLSDQLFTIGKANSYFPGHIDEVTLHAAALTESQLAEIANARGSGICTATDTTPAAFAFTDQTGVAPGSVITSDPITVAGIDFPTAISITACIGPGPCEYEINTSGIWLTDPATVTNGDTVAVRQTSSGSYGAQTDLTLDIGGVSDTFSVTTVNAYTVTANADGTGSGTVASDPGGISYSYPAASTGTSSALDYGSSITLTATADTGSTVSWSGCASTGGTTTAATCTFSGLDSNQTVTATFTVNTYTVTADAAGTGSGTVSSDPGGISYSYPAASTGTSSALDHGSAITVTATADTGSTVSWSGCASTGGTSTEATCTFSSLSGNETVTATFTLNTYTVTANAAGTGSGTISSDVGGISYSYPAASTGTSTALNHGSAITVTATAETGSTVSWSGCGSTGGTTMAATCAFSGLDGNQSATATFILDTHILSVTLAGNGAGTVTSSPAGIDCGEDCSVAYDYGTEVTLTAALAAGSTFMGWSGDADCTDGSVMMTTDVNCTATFSTSFPWIMFHSILTGAGTK
jgi:hypothetical protein